MLAVELAKYIQRCTKWFQRRKKQSDLQNYKSFYVAWVKIVIGHKNHCWNQSFLLCLVGCISAIVCFYWWRSRNQGLIFMHAFFPNAFFSMTSWAQCIFTNTLCVFYVSCHEFVDIFLSFFATQNSRVENTNAMLLYYISPYSSCGSAFGRNSWRYILANERAGKELILQPHIELSLYFRNIFPYFLHGQFW